MMDARPDDRLFNCLPMYHSVGGVVAIGRDARRRRLGGDRARSSPPAASGTISLAGAARSFSISANSAATCCAAPPRPQRTRASPAARLRQRAQRRSSGRAFQERFAIPRILEFYAATEGNFSLFNVEGEPGAIGRVPGFLRPPIPGAARRASTQRPARRRAAPTGSACAVARGEAGEAIGRIGGAAGDRARVFEGYTDAAQSEKKMLRDVFEPGDAWLRTGDLMRQDEQRLLLFRRSYRRHVPLEGRECLHGRGGRCHRAPALASRPPPSMA